MLSPSVPMQERGKGKRLRTQPTKVLCLEGISFYESHHFVIPRILLSIQCL